MYRSDVLTCAPVETANKNCTALQEEVESHIAAITLGLPATKPSSYLCVQPALPRGAQFLDTFHISYDHSLQQQHALNHLIVMHLHLILNTLLFCHVGSIALR